MKDIKSFYVGSIFVAFAVMCGAFFGGFSPKNNDISQNIFVENTSFGSFLAAQHAIYVNDFRSASKLLSGLDDSVDKFDSVKRE